MPDQYLVRRRRPSTFSYAVKRTLKAVECFYDNYSKEAVAIGKTTTASQRPFIRHPPPCVFVPSLRRRDPEDGMYLVEKMESRCLKELNQCVVDRCVGRHNDIEWDVIQIPQKSYAIKSSPKVVHRAAAQSEFHNEVPRYSVSAPQLVIRVPGVYEDDAGDEEYQVFHYYFPSNYRNPKESQAIPDKTNTVWTTSLTSVVPTPVVQTVYEPPRSVTILAQQHTPSVAQRVPSTVNINAVQPTWSDSVDGNTFVAGASAPIVGLSHVLSTPQYNTPVPTSAARIYVPLPVEVQYSDPLAPVQPPVGVAPQCSEPAQRHCVHVTAPQQPTPKLSTFSSGTPLAASCTGSTTSDSKVVLRHEALSHLNQQPAASYDPVVHIEAQKCGAVQCTECLRQNDVAMPEVELSCEQCGAETVNKCDCGVASTNAWRLSSRSSDVRPACCCGMVGHQQAAEAKMSPVECHSGHQCSVVMRAVDSRPRVVDREKSIRSAACLCNRGDGAMQAEVSEPCRVHDCKGRNEIFCGSSCIEQPIVVTEAQQQRSKVQSHNGCFSGDSTSMVKVQRSQECRSAISQSEELKGRPVILVSEERTPLDCAHSASTIYAPRCQTEI